MEENSVSLNSNHVSEKKEPGPGVHSKVQPTTEQLMIAKIIDHSASDDPHQRKKIQQVMDVTGKPEDEVATALFDAGWDESRAVELLLGEPQLHTDHSEMPFCARSLHIICLLGLIIKRVKNLLLHMSSKVCWLKKLNNVDKNKIIYMN